jgi:hypothetical protein
LSLFIDDMIVHIDNLKESTSVYITRWVSEFSKEA